MLVRIYKNTRDLDCKCKVIKFVDRIWLGETSALEDAIVQREFIIEVDSNSPTPLHEIRMLIPRVVVSPRDMSHTWMQADYAPNTAYLGGMLDTRNFGSTPGGASWGEMEVDGISQVKFYVSYGGSAQPPSIKDVAEKYSLLVIPFPIPLQPGEKRAFRVNFTAKDFLENRSTSMEHIYEFNFSYFSANIYKTFLDYYHKVSPVPLVDLGGQDEVEALMVYCKEIGFPGGFDIFLILPEGHEAVNIRGEEERISHDFDLDGKPLSKARDKLRWRMRTLDRKRFEENKLSLTCGHYLCTFVATPPSGNRSAWP